MSRRQKSRSWGMLSLAVAAALLSACSPAPAPMISLPPIDGDALTGVDTSRASTAQAAEIADQFVTEEEYHAAFRRYRECLSDAGFEMIEVRLARHVYDAVIPEEAVEDGTDEECHTSEFAFTEMLWQATDAVVDGSLAAELARACLERHGVRPAETLREMDVQLRDAGITELDCDA